MNKKIIVGVILFLLILSFGFVLIKSIKFSAKGQIIDSVNNKPIQNVLVERSAQKNQCSVAGCSWGPRILVNQDVTNNEGLFSLDNYYLFTPSGYGESVVVSKEGYYPTLVGKGKNRSVYSMIKIAPEVELLEKCNGDSLCISENSFYFAMKNKDVSLCKEISTHDKFTDESYYKSFSDQSARCIELFAVNYNDSSVCDLIDELDFNDSGWKDWKKRVCMQNIDRSINMPCDAIFGDEDISNLKYEREEQICRSVFESF